MNRITLRLFTVSLLALSTAAQAATPAPVSSNASAERSAAAFSKADTNGDGSISKEEFLAKPTQRFNEIDTNHDGKISPQEMNTYRAAKKAERDKHKAAKLAAMKSSTAKPAATPAPATK